MNSCRPTNWTIEIVLPRWKTHPFWFQPFTARLQKLRQRGTTLGRQGFRVWAHTGHLPASFISESSWAASTCTLGEGPGAFFRVQPLSSCLWFSTCTTEPTRSSVNLKITILPLITFPPWLMTYINSIRGRAFSLFNANYNGHNMGKDDVGSYSFF